jgi:dTDP-4-dehydrorhamnose 3,5-epimerase
MSTDLESRTVVLGANGQLGRALRTRFPSATFLTRADLDLGADGLRDCLPWRDFDRVVNASAYTKVDRAETDEGRREAWATNASAMASLATIASECELELVHFSTDYVFDGSREVHDEDEPFSPLGVYGQTKAAGDLAVSTVPHHYIIRTSWVIGDGPNFIRAMLDLARRGISPRVVNDQFGRLTFTTDLARAVEHLVTVGARRGTYNLSSSGKSSTWFEVAQRVFELAGHDPQRVNGISTDEYFADTMSAPRPRFSTLGLDRINALGFDTSDQDAALERYVQGELSR